MDDKQMSELYIIYRWRTLAHFGISCGLWF